MTGLLTAIGLLTLFGTCCAQQSRKAKPVSRIDSASHVRPWDVSMDLYRLIKGGPMTFTLRRMAKGNGAYRLALYGGIGKTKHKDMNTIDSSLATERNWNIGVALGYEWQKNVKKHQLIYGVDLRYTHSSNYSGTVGNFYGETLIHMAFLESFIGFKYRLRPELSISAEVSCGPSMHYISNWNLTAHQRTGFSRTFGFGIDPFRLINLSYHF